MTTFVWDSYFLIEPLSDNLKSDYKRHYQASDH